MEGMRRDREDGPVASVARPPTPVKRIKIADQVLTYLREKSKRETELKREELALRREELDLELAKERLAMEKADKAEMLKMLGAQK